MRYHTFSTASTSWCTHFRSMTARWFVVEYTTIVKQRLPSITFDWCTVNKFIDMIETKISRNWKMFSLKLSASYMAFLSCLRSFEANSGRTSRKRIFGPGCVRSSWSNRGVKAKRMHSLNTYVFHFLSNHRISFFSYRWSAASASRCLAISRPNERLNRRANS